MVRSVEVGCLRLCFDPTGYSLLRCVYVLDLDCWVGIDIWYVF